MCGITAFFARESVPDIKVIDQLFTGAENRGIDGFGYVWIKVCHDGKRHIADVKRFAEPYSEVREHVLNEFDGKMKIGDLIIGIARAAPETEPMTDVNELERTLQPILDRQNSNIVVHNGAVSNSILQNLKVSCAEFDKYHFHTDIDSEAILASYMIHGKNIKYTMEFLSGGFASIMYDEEKDMMYAITDFKPIAQAYIKGLGFFLHSDNDVLGEIICDATGCRKDGVCMWENFFHHYLSGPTIREIDLQSGFVKKIKYSPRYRTQKWDSNFGGIS